MSNVTMREMLEAGVHFGHQARFWDPKMAPYLFGQRNKIHIINLEKTLPLYNEAVNFIGKLAARKGTILFVGTKRAAQDIIREEASRCSMPYVNRRWLGGLLTNFKTVKRSISRYKDLEAMHEDGSLERLSKKDLLRHNRELEKLERSLSGIKDMPSIPDALFIVDVGYENIACCEARKLGITVIGIVDSNNSPDKVDYIIPGNDDAIRSIRLYAKGMADAVLDGRQSTAQVILDNNIDEFIELDESGEPVLQPEIKKASKVVIKKKAIKKDINVSVKEIQDALEKPTAKKPKPVEKEEKDKEVEIDVVVDVEVANKKKVTKKKAETKKKATKKKATTKKKVTKKKAT